MTIERVQAQRQGRPGDRSASAEGVHLLNPGQALVCNDGSSEKIGGKFRGVETCPSKGV
jgi:hypothetical protein